MTLRLYKWTLRLYKMTLRLYNGPPNTPPTQSQNRFGPQSKNLASIIRGYKIGVTKFARQNNLSFAWQPRYHDHVIRNAKEYERISQYILANVQNWAADEFNNQLLDKMYTKRGYAENL